MPSQSFIASVLLASTAAANPISQMLKRNGPDNCGGDLDGQPYVANVRYFSDKDCSQNIGFQCIYTTQDIIDDGSGVAGCNPANVPATTPYYVQVADTGFGDLQLAYTHDQSCPPNGAGAVVATLGSNQDCVMLNIGGDAPGLAVYPNGGSGLGRKAKRDSTSCSGFNINSQTDSESASVQVSNEVDCINGASGGCTITEGEQHTESVSTSYSVDAGLEIDGLGVSETFGVEYTESETSSIQEGFTIAAGQKGYLSAYSHATLFEGTFTGCDDGDMDGKVLAVKDNGFVYSIILT